MATAESVISRALSLILVRQSESPLQPDEFQDGIDTMNDMLTQWDGAGLSLGYTIVTSLSDEVTVAPFALLAIKQNLAIQLAPEFGGNVDQILFTNAADSLKQLRQAVIKPIPSRFPCTLPTGSGNDTGDDFSNRKFFHGCEDNGILTEQDGNILLETNDQEFSS